MQSRSTGRGRKIGGALLALFALAVVLAWLALRDRSPDDGMDRATSATEDESARVSDAPARRRARAAAAGADTAPAPADASDSGEPAHLDGWPAADVIVLRSDGTPLQNATVYVLPAGESAVPGQPIPVRRTTPGPSRFPVAAAGRYDVGAFGNEPFGALVTDVEFPARSQVRIVLPELVPLEIRTEGDLPKSGWVSVARADAARIVAYPGRAESRYVGGFVRDLGSRVLVPRGERMRVRATGGVVATPEEVVAPGPVTIRADPRREVEVEFVFVAAPDLASQRLQFTFRYERTPGDPDSRDAGIVRLRPAPDVTTRRVKLLCPPALTTVRWACTSDPSGEGGEAVLDAAAVPAGGVHRIEVPVRREDLHLFGFRVVAPEGSAAKDLRVLTSFGRLFEYEEVVPGQEYWFASPIEESHGWRAVDECIAAVAPTDDGWLVAAPTNVAPDRVVDLPLVPGALILVSWSRPTGLDATEPLGVSLAEPRLLADLLVAAPTVPSPALVHEARLLYSSAGLGPFPAGDVELVFRFGGREVGREKVRVVPGTHIAVDVPEIRPPPR